ncbi:hypothetical protein E0500_015035 [Streptomyces sp. KM273126]|uniref:hypothetical protein n=1 Tax=Streptomyces sp. KM273126 TaxID=2545247 RepID=UPI0015EB9EF1|nr:hypothetical protein [Streptomyces sp. KM273126]MBA2808676.1 hypothetical protein [Streptomyces sp. KM273126]
MQQPDEAPQPSPQPSPPPPPGFGPPPPPYAPPAQPNTPPPGQPYAPPPAPPGQPYAPPPAPPGQPYAQPPQAYGAPPPNPYAAPYPAAPAAPPGQPTVPQGPEFLAVDLHNSIVVDASGVSFEDHGASVDFPWPEVRSVHYKPSTNNKGLVMGVAHVDGRFYECVVDAKGRDRLQEWFAQLLPVLQYYRPMG